MSGTQAIQAVAERRSARLLGERGAGGLPDTRVLLIIAVGAWVFSQIVVMVLLGAFTMSHSNESPIHGPDHGNSSRAGVPFEPAQPAPKFSADAGASGP